MWFILFILICSDGETFISADDLRINLWNLEISNQSFNIVDVKPANMEDLTGTSYSQIILQIVEITYLLQKGPVLWKIHHLIGEV